MKCRAGFFAGLGMAAAATVMAAPAFANSAAVDYFRTRADRTEVPSLLSQDDRAYYKQIFDAIDSKDWPAVQKMLADRPDGPLHQQARAEYYPAAGSPKISLPDLQAWPAQDRKDAA